MKWTGRQGTWFTTGSPRLLSMTPGHFPVVSKPLCCLGTASNCMWGELKNSDNSLSEVYLSLHVKMSRAGQARGSWKSSKAQDPNSLLPVFSRRLPRLRQAAPLSSAGDFGHCTPSPAPVIQAESRGDFRESGGRNEEQNFLRNHRARPLLSHRRNCTPSSVGGRDVSFVPWADSQAP